MPMSSTLFTADDKYIKEVYDILSKNIRIVRKQKELLIVDNDKKKVISKVNMNEYDTIISLKLPRRYGYLNNFLLSKLMGLVYKNKTTNK